jgi:LemA protein
MGYVILILVGGFLIWWIMTYNGLIAKNNQKKNAFASIDVQLKKRHDLIPNLVETVKGYMAHERQVLEEVTRLRSEARRSALSSPERMEAESQISARLGEINLRAEAYPDLKASENFLHLQRLLAEIEEQISASRRAYNGAVMEINNAIEMFPSSIVAKTMPLEKGPFFQATSIERENPGVHLHPPTAS